MGNKLVFGTTVYDDTQLLSGNCVLSTNISMSELTIDTLTSDIQTASSLPTIFSPSDANTLETTDGQYLTVSPWVKVQTSDPGAFRYGEECRYYHDDVLIGIFYMESIKRIGATSYEINCISAIGLLDKSTYYGGLWLGAASTTVEALLSDIIGGIVPWTLDEKLKKLRVYGWLPVSTRREALHQLLFAEGISLKKTADGRLWFTTLNYDTPVYIPGNKIFIGGDIDFRTPANRVHVYEHTYLSTSNDEQKTLYEGSVEFGTSVNAPSGAVRDGILVTFDAPIHSLSITGGTILESGVNYAVLGPTNGCILTGKLYAHTTRTVTRQRAAAREIVEKKDNEVTVKNVTLISPINSDNVADRMMAYYGSAAVVSNEFVLDDVRPGAPVRFEDPFGQEASGYLQSVDITMSKLLRAAGTIITGYTYVSPGGDYSNRVAFTSNFTWTPPAGVARAKVILIGGGSAGAPGMNGENGTNGTAARVIKYMTGSEVKQGTPGTPGRGGAKGSGGSGGKIMTLTLELSGASTVTGQVGSKNGGVSSVTAGGRTYSSDSGAVSVTGYTDIMTGETYALPGSPGDHDGGSGGKAVSGTTGSGESGESVAGYHGGAGNRWSYLQWEDGNASGHTLPAGGGGAAYGENGIDANSYCSGGRGGNAVTSKAAPTVPGCGGHGGNGGGGGGAGGAGYIDGPATSGVGNPGFGGSGGSGSPGTDGASGIVIIYY